MKIMKFKIVLLVIIGVLSKGLDAQDIYLKLNAGQNFSSSRPIFPIENVTNKYNFDGSETVTKELVEGSSLGKGLNFDGTLGFKIVKNIALEMKLSFLFGSDVKSSNVNIYDNVFPNYRFERNTSYNAKMLRFNPSIIINSGIESINPYVRIGLVFGVGNIKIIQDEIDYNPNLAYDEIEHLHAEVKLNEGLAFGYNASIGLEKELSKTISIFAEINFLSLNYAPVKGTLDVLEINGHSLTSKLSKNEKVTEYVDEFSSTFFESDEFDKNEVKVDLKTTFPFSSIGINLGIIFTFISYENWLKQN